MLQIAWAIGHSGWTPRRSSAWEISSTRTGRSAKKEGPARPFHPTITISRCLCPSVHLFPSVCLLCCSVSGVDDPQFTDKFEQTFTAPSLQVPWITCTGNHDWYGGVESIDAELQYTHRSPRWHFPALNFTYTLHGPVRPHTLTHTHIWWLERLWMPCVVLCCVLSVRVVCEC